LRARASEHRRAYCGARAAKNKEQRHWMTEGERESDGPLCLKHLWFGVGGRMDGFVWLLNLPRRQKSTHLPSLLFQLIKYHHRRSKIKGLEGSSPHFFSDSQKIDEETDFCKPHFIHRGESDFIFSYELWFFGAGFKNVKIKIL
jgi:hypothetical protein